MPPVIPSEPSTQGQVQQASPPTDDQQSRLQQTDHFRSTPASLAFDEKATTPHDDPAARSRYLPPPVSGNFGPYELLEEVARGGMGIVYKARDPRLGRIVAIKTIRPDILGLSEDHLKRFFREARAIAHLTHPNIVPIYEVEQHEGQHYLVMAYMAGGSLAEHKQRYTEDPRATATLVEKLARAIHHAHEKGILHRDLKPGNVLLDEAGTPFISDFGLAKFRDEEIELTRSEEVVGTPSYMAPEQTSAGSKEITAAADVWALGVLLFELLTGSRPFLGKTRDEIIAQIRRAEPLRPRKVKPGLDRDLEAITLKCLEKNPKDRYASAANLADDLGRWLAGESILRSSLTRRVLRKARRKPAVAVACLFLGIGIITATVLYESHPLRSMERKLARGESVTLIGETGAPQWFSWPIGQGGSVAAQSDNEGLWSFSTIEGMGLLELAPTVPPRGFRFSAEVRHDVAAKKMSSRVGIYLGHSSRVVAEGREHYFSSLTFSDCAPAIRDHKNVSNRLVSLDLHRYQTWTTGDFNTDTSVYRELQASGAVRAPRWHRLGLEVKPESINVFWDDQSIGTFADEEFRRRAVKLQVFDPQLPMTPVAFIPPFPSQGAVGLCALEGLARYRNVRMVPLN